MLNSKKLWVVIDIITFLVQLANIILVFLLKNHTSLRILAVGGWVSCMLWYWLYVSQRNWSEERIEVRSKLLNAQKDLIDDLLGTLTELKKVKKASVARSTDGIKRGRPQKQAK